MVIGMSEMTVHAPVDIQAATNALARKLLLGAWRRWRDAARAHNAQVSLLPEHARIAALSVPPNIRHVGLPTWSEVAQTHSAWAELSAAYRSAFTPAPTVGHVAKMGAAYEAVCPEHPWFRRVAWTRPSTPLTSAREHNTEHHDGAPARVYEVADREPSSLLP